MEDFITMKRLVLTFVAAMLLAATGIAARSASAANADGSVTVRVAMCAPGMSLATLNPDGCLSLATDYDLALYDFANDVSYGLIQATDNGDGSLSWVGLSVDDTQAGGLAGRFRLAVPVWPEGAVAYATVGDYDPDGDVTYLTGDAPHAGIDLYFFQNHPIDDVIVDDANLAGSVQVGAFTCPAGVEPQDPDGWAAACTDPINGMPFTLSGVDDIAFEETRVTGQEIVGATVFPDLPSANYSLSKGPFDKQALGFWSCDTAAEYGADGHVAFGLDSGQVVSCSYYWLSDEDVVEDFPIDNGGEQVLEGAVHVANYACPAGFAPADSDAWAATCLDPLNGMAVTLSGLDIPFEESIQSGQAGQPVPGTAIFEGLAAGTYAVGETLYDKMLLGYTVCDAAAEYGANGYAAFVLDPVQDQDVFCARYWVPAPDAPTPDDTTDAAVNEQSTVIALPNTGSGETAGLTPNAEITIPAAVAVLLLALATLATARVRTRS